jgi:DNA-binding NarL/FixJ family response regulator
VSDRIRLLVADRAATRIGIRLVLEDRVDICAEADTAEQAIRAAMQEQPDVCLIGREIPGGGLTAVRGICRAAPGAGVIVLADAYEVDDMLDAVRAGAVGYVPGSVRPERLQKIIESVMAREAALPRAMVLDILMELRASGSHVDGLTGREAQVLGMLRRGHTTAHIADRLEITPVTVRRHISELVRKLGVADRSELIAPGLELDAANERAA